MTVIDGYRSTHLRDVLTIRDIFTIHYFEYTKDFSFSGESHDFWEMCYVDNGVVEVFTEDEQHTLFKGDAIFHEPGEFHRLRGNGRTAPNLVVFSFACDSPAMSWFSSRLMRIHERERSLMGRIIYEARRGFTSPLDDPLSDGLDRAEQQPFGCEQIIKNYLEELLINLVRTDVAISRSDKSEGIVSVETRKTAFGKVVNYMMDNLTRDITIADICRATGYSRSHLHKVFKERSGRSVAEYHKRLRIEKVKQMIREGGRNFSEIAAAMNYSSLQYFSRIFKKLVGMTSSEYAASVKLISDFSDYGGKPRFPGPLGRI